MYPKQPASKKKNQETAAALAAAASLAGMPQGVGSQQLEQPGEGTPTDEQTHSDNFSTQATVLSTIPSPETHPTIAPAQNNGVQTDSANAGEDTGQREQGAESQDSPRAQGTNSPAARRSSLSPSANPRNPDPTDPAKSASDTAWNGALIGFVIGCVIAFPVVIVTSILTGGAATPVWIAFFAALGSIGVGTGIGWGVGKSQNQGYKPLEEGHGDGPGEGGTLVDAVRADGVGHQPADQSRQTNNRSPTNSTGGIVDALSTNDSARDDHDSVLPMPVTNQADELESTTHQKNTRFVVDSPFNWNAIREASPPPNNGVFSGSGSANPVIKRNLQDAFDSSLSDDDEGETTSQSADSNSSAQQPAQPQMPTNMKTGPGQGDDAAELRVDGSPQSPILTH